MERAVLHSDCNNFFASVETVYDPSLRSVPMAVCGDPEKRHGIILAKNQLAKRYGVQTGEPIWQAKQKCGTLRLVPPHFDRYLAFSRAVRGIYGRYTDQVESFSLDECWLDVTGSRALFGDGPRIADELRESVRRELGITVSVGVSFNKVFAKLGSDLKKPDATTVITPQDFREKLWPLPASDLLFVGRATQRALASVGVFTIGELARCDCALLERSLGKAGDTLWAYANGLDTSPVSVVGETAAIKSIGNSTTAPRDLTGPEDVKLVFGALCDSVAGRLRGCGFRCTVVTISVRDTQLRWFERQQKLTSPTCVTRELMEAAMQLYRGNCAPDAPIRSLGVRASGLVSGDAPQLSLYAEAARAEREERMELAVDRVRQRYGREAVFAGRLWRPA